MRIHVAALVHKIELAAAEADLGTGPEKPAVQRVGAGKPRYPHVAGLLDQTVFLRLFAFN